MTSDLYGDAEATDGIVGFHYVTIQGQRDSEFLRLRDRQEPIPQSEQNKGVSAMKTIAMATVLFALLTPGTLLADDVIRAAPKAQAASSLQMTLRLGSANALPGITDGIWLDAA